MLYLLTMLKSRRRDCKDRESGIHIHSLRYNGQDHVGSSLAGIIAGKEYPLQRGTWHSQGIRFFLVRNYLVFYTINTENDTVSVARIMYGARYITHQLDETTVFENANHIRHNIIFSHESKTFSKYIDTSEGLQF